MRHAAFGRACLRYPAWSRMPTSGTAEQTAFDCQKRQVLSPTQFNNWHLNCTLLWLVARSCNENANCNHIAAAFHVKFGESKHHILTSASIASAAAKIGAAHHSISCVGVDSLCGAGDDMWGFSGIAARLAHRPGAQSVS